MAKKTAITPTRSENYPEWYQEVIKAADLAENSPVRGCMIIKPWGYAIWERIQAILDRMLKDTGHVNAYFPVLIPLNFMEKEAQHVDGFAKECAVVTHHRLTVNEEGALIPDGQLDEPYIIRPTSETVIGDAFSRWIQSYRDLPVLINQWANVMRWELRPRLFLRTSEFLWQEGHTAHATPEEGLEETRKILDLYTNLSERYLAMPVIRGAKTPGERFPGAVETYAIEAMMQDGRALQAGTSHFLGQNFAKAMGINFQNEQGQQELVWTTSWGVSTRLIGGLIMAHSDDDGLVLPPKIAPMQVVLLPIFHNPENKVEVMAHADQLFQELKTLSYNGEPLRVELDSSDRRGGEKVWHHIKRGVPIRVEIGPKEVESDSVFVGRRDQEARHRTTLPRNEFVQIVSEMLSEIDETILRRARKLQQKSTETVDSLDALKEFFTQTHDGVLTTGGGFALAHWNDVAEGNDVLAELKVTPRCVPLDGEAEPGKCIFTGQPSKRQVLFAKAY
ncbi:MAG: proline--tRNA ligase [Acidobacteriota bacterium]|nr:proline--tRNA ligase [Acidobacteriota bacterium]